NTTLRVLQPRVAVIAIGQVELVDDKNLRLHGVGDDAIDALVLNADGTGRINDMDEDFDAFKRVANFVMKVLHEPARLRLENAGGIDKNDLAFRPMDDAVVRIARGLR